MKRIYQYLVIFYLIVAPSAPIFILCMEILSETNIKVPIKVPILFTSSKFIDHNHIDKFSLHFGSWDPSLSLVWDLENSSVFSRGK